MHNNAILRSLRYTLNLSDTEMIALFGLAACQVTRSQVSDWLKADDDPAYQQCNDAQLAFFLNGLVLDRRGRKEGAQPRVEKRLSNNIIFRKLRIALDLKDDEILQIMSLAGLSMSKHELSAFFRRPGHKNFRFCKDQILRNFLRGLQVKFRPALPPTPQAWPANRD